MYDPREAARDAREGRPGRQDARASRLPSRELERLHDARRPALERDTMLTPAQQRILSDIGAFRLAREEDLGKRTDLRRLADRGFTTVRPSRMGERYVALTKLGARHLRIARPTRSQAIHVGFPQRRGDRGLKHDAAVYRACRAETSRQESGTRLTRISLDIDLRADILKDVARTERELKRPLEPHELELIAQRYQVAVDQESRIHYPDAQLEFEREDGSRYAVGVEVTTDDYRSAAIGAKRDAGFSMYHLPSSPGAGVPSRVEGTGRAPVRIEEYELWAL